MCDFVEKESSRGSFVRLRYGDNVMKIITLRQPWAELVVSGVKNIENRGWSTAYRGPVLIHAGLHVEREACRKHGVDPSKLPRGAVVGVVELADCVTKHRSPWFSGRYGFVLRNARKIKPIQWKGALNLREAPPELLRRIERL
jgi:ASCH domain